MVAQKVALIIKDFDPTRGGGERFAVELARSLKKEGVPLEIIARTAFNELLDQFNVHLCPPGPLTISAQSSFNHAVQKFFRKFHFSCKIALTQVTGCEIYRVGGGLLRHWEKLKYTGPGGKLRQMISINNYQLRSLEDKLFSDPNLKITVANSKLVKDQLELYYPNLASRIEFIPNGINRTEFFFDDIDEIKKETFRKKHQIKPTSRTLLFVSNNFHRKGLPELIEVIAKSSFKNQLTLLVAGSGESLNCERLINRFNLFQTVHFLGVQTDMAFLYRNSDLLILPTRYDPCSNACLEALACGLPVLTTDQNGAKMFLTAGGGIIIPSHPLKENLANALHQWFKDELDPAIRYKAETSVKELVYEKISKRWCELIDEIHRNHSNSD